MDMSSFLSASGNPILDIVGFVIAISVIVAVHEYGHYIVGRWTGIKADVFSLGMGPVLLKRTDKHGTQWQIAAMPIGGYVKFAGDANAASAGADDAAMEGLSAEERRHTMHGAPLWARALTVLAGPVFNFILAVVVFAGLAYQTGVATDPLTVKSLVDVPGVEELQPGDQLLAIDGRETPKLEDFSAFVSDLPKTQALLDYLVLRDGRDVTVTARHPFPPMVGSVTTGSAAAEAGLQVGDLILAVNGEEVATFAQLPAYVTESNGEALTLTILRAGESLDVTLAPRRMDLPTEDGGFETRWLIGIGGDMIFEPASRAPSLGEALTSGVRGLEYTITTSLSALYHIAAGKISTCNLSGPIGIANVMGDAVSNGLVDIITKIAFLSAAIGLLNLLPIPVLDGGHLVFHAYEAVVGRPPSDGFMRVMLMIGIAIVIGVMVLGLSSDLFC